MRRKIATKPIKMCKKRLFSADISADIDPLLALLGCKLAGEHGAIPIKKEQYQFQMVRNCPHDEYPEDRYYYGAKLLRSSYYDTYCSEPNQNVSKIYDALKFRFAPFVKKKSVVHKYELANYQFIDNQFFYFSINAM